MKAYNTYVYHPFDSGCLIVFAKTRDNARYVAWQALWSDGSEYIEVRAIRVPSLDQYYQDPTPRCFIDNYDLAKVGAPPFYTEEIEI